MDSREPSRMNSSDSPNMVGGQGQTPNIVGGQGQTPNMVGGQGQNSLNSYGPQPLQTTPMSIPNSTATMPPMHLSFSTQPQPQPQQQPPQPPQSLPKPLESSPGTAYNGETSLEMRHSIGVSATEPLRKKRGRPRKYGPDGSVTLGLTPPYSGPGSEHGSGQPTSESAGKKRGRPPGSGKKQQLDALGAFGTGFTAHVISVNPGEDVASTIMAFSQQGPRTVCVLSANGVISNVALRQPASFGGTVTYEGRFEIINLAGSYSLNEDAGSRSRSGGLSVSLAGSDGRVLGGGVAGVLTAATPVQVILGSFIAEGKKPKQPEPIKIDPPVSQQPQYPGGFGGPPVVSPHQSEGSVSESSEEEELGSPPNHSVGAYNHSIGQHPPPNMPAYTPMTWGQPMGQQRQ